MRDGARWLDIGVPDGAAPVLRDFVSLASS